MTTDNSLQFEQTHSQALADAGMYVFMGDVEQDISTLAIALYGNQTKSIEDGIYTIYDSNNNIYKQYNLYEIRTQFNELLYEVRQDRGTNIDKNKDFNNIIA